MIKFKRLHEDARLPERAHHGDAAFDVFAYEGLTVAPGQRVMIGSGWTMALPYGFVAMVLPRSGLALRHGITVANAPGLIDPNYRGELGVVLINHGDEPFEVEPGHRIAQLLVVKFMEPNVLEVEKLPPPPDARGEGGFGSTGR